MKTKTYLILSIVLLTGVSCSNTNYIQAVDLGLPSGLKWASCNVGATTPEDYGDYYAWGETTPKYDYSWTTYKYAYNDDRTLFKYCNKAKYKYGDIGFIDNKTVLEPEDDAAHANWGGKWRMPTYAEWTELLENCTWTWTRQNGILGYQVASKTNGNSIFLPAARGYYGTNFAGHGGDYWSSSLYEYRPNSAWEFNFDSGYVGWDNSHRSNGKSVRPVCL